MIRGLKGTLALLALVAVGLLLRWMTAGSISGARTYDLDSLTVLAVGTVAWIAYVWLVLAVVTTVLEQIPGVVGELAGAVAGRITTKTARALLRSGLGVAAVTPLTVTAAQAAPTHSTQVLQWTQSERPSAISLTDSNWRPTEPASKLQLGTTNTHRVATQPPVTEARQESVTAKSEQESADSWRSTEPASRVQIGGADVQRTADAQPTAIENQQVSESSKSQQESADSWRSTEPASKVRIGGADARRADAGLSAAESRQNTAGTTSGQDVGDGSGRPSAGERMRVGVPDRPADGAPTRYTEVRAGGAVRVVVRGGDSLWGLAARELGAGASDEAIAARWPQWYAANRQVIGDDPDLILPGQVLRVPPASTGHLPPTHQEP
ncbi:hypothetical protein OHA10_18910 [Kribbella sp. NBC_00662]|uniref:LysM peptidoglycan-binding domain-containing protein n=1 Tax=Kribbella sp. NBC_00662 TaxID=2975969 RepID=UPI003246AAC0